VSITPIHQTDQQKLHTNGRAREMNQLTLEAPINVLPDVGRRSSSADRPLEVGEIVIQDFFDLTCDRPAERREQTGWKPS